MKSSIAIAVFLGLQSLALPLGTTIQIRNQKANIEEIGLFHRENRSIWKRTSDGSVHSGIEMQPMQQPKPSEPQRSESQPQPGRASSFTSSAADMKTLVPSSPSSQYIDTEPGSIGPGSPRPGSSRQNSVDRPDDTQQDPETSNPPDTSSGGPLTEAQQYKAQIEAGWEASAKKGKTE